MILVFFVVIPLTAAAVDWCSDDLQCAYYDPPDNTMCRYKDEVETPRCTNVVNLQNDSSRQLMVMMHNDIRWWTAMGKIPGLPPASNMKMLRYDMTLEKIAYRWATQCMSAHDLCRKTPKWHALGQNISPNYSSTPYFEADPFTDFQAWWNHKKGIDSEIIDSYYVPLPSKMYMFTQIIWANTESIGCATIAYKRTTKSDPCPYERFTVCNYGPGGNIVNHPVYERGEPCSNCPAGDCICNVSPSLLLDVPDDSKLESARNGARRKPIKEYIMLFHLDTARQTKRGEIDKIILVNSGAGKKWNVRMKFLQ
ncbi:hypothetical protein GE061_003375 [Apolygus lucorum]|uniref:SCP domain-containing protein n=1 Tax=Apolygus lucorum TaxID=248454 RepID=A0A8S9X1V4_APOLU|nr:hypothetical protein GE061_003375 [Apolygus lucorum]